MLQGVALQRCLDEAGQERAVLEESMMALTTQLGNLERAKEEQIAALDS